MMDSCGGEHTWRARKPPRTCSVCGAWEASPVGSPEDFFHSDEHQLSEGVTSYLLTRNTPWATTEGELREIVTEAVRLIFNDAVYDALAILKGRGYIIR